jgi:hypothetical protein
MPRKIFGLKREEVKGEWRRLHKEELHNFYSLPNIILDKPMFNAIGRESCTYGRRQMCRQNFVGQIYGEESSWKT